MIYLSGVACPELVKLARTYPVGLMGQPGSYGARTHAQYELVGLDNGCFTKPIMPGTRNEARWQRWLGRQRVAGIQPLFVVVPDVPYDAAATFDLFGYYRRQLASWPLAFALQNGSEAPGLVPWDDIAAVFIGGDTAWKLSHHALYLAWQAKDRGLHVHLGRANSYRRIMRAVECQADSADGTLLRQPKNAARLAAMFDKIPATPQLALA
jgi:hypothetical protein